MTHLLEQLLCVKCIKIISYSVYTNAAYKCLSIRKTKSIVFICYFSYINKTLKIIKPEFIQLFTFFAFSFTIIQIKTNQKDKFTFYLSF